MGERTVNCMIVEICAKASKLLRRISVLGTFHP